METSERGRSGLSLFFNRSAMSQITKMALEASLKKLLRTKPLDKITIQEITDDCGISRSAFYYHFEDIYALVEWCALEDFSKALGGRKTMDTWEDGLRAILQEVVEEKDFISNIYHNANHDLIVKYLSAQTEQLLFGVVQEESKGLTVTEGQKHYVAHFYQFGFVGMVTEWFGKGMKEDIDAFVDRFATMLNGSFRNALEQFDQCNKGLKAK